MNILDYMKNNTLYLDGGMGTLLQEAGLAPLVQGEQVEDHIGHKKPSF